MARRHLGRRKTIVSIEQLRDAVTHYERLTAALAANRDDMQLNRMWGQAADVLIGGQLQYLQDGLATQSADGSIVTDLTNGRELVVWLFVETELGPKGQLAARGWLKERGVPPKLENLRGEVWGALEAGALLPNDLFRGLASRIAIRDRADCAQLKAVQPDLLRRMRSAADTYERAQERLRLSPDDLAARSELRTSRDEIIRIMLAQAKDPVLKVVELDDGSSSSDLGDGREVNVNVGMKQKPSKKWRSTAIAWLEDRGIHRLEDLPQQLWGSQNDDDFPADLFKAMVKVDITIRPTSNLP